MMAKRKAADILTWGKDKPTTDKLMNQLYCMADG
jgi:hypothetical protein